MRFFLFSLIIAILAGCSMNRERNKFSGNWYTCARDGIYIELLIKDGSFRYSTSNGLVTNWYNFKMLNDTLKYTDSFLYKDSTIVVKAKVSMLKNDDMQLDFISTEEHWIFHKITENISDIENENNLKISTRQRAQQIKCPDERTKEEKSNDSLIRQLYFQF